MGTFHEGRGDLHGITVVVDTHGPEVWVGRCDTITDEGVILLGADQFSGDPSSEDPSSEDQASGGANGAGQAEWLEKAARFGVWPRHDRVVVPASSVASIRRLSDL